MPGVNGIVDPDKIREQIQLIKEHMKFLEVRITSSFGHYSSKTRLWISLMEDEIDSLAGLHGRG